MIIDVTGVQLIPGNGGADCPGNGERVGDNGKIIECCCDECDYMLCCYEDMPCADCVDPDCPHSPHHNQNARL